MSTTKFYSDSFAQENIQAHRNHLQYGSVTGYAFYFGKETVPILSLIRDLKPNNILDYGCGKGLGADNIIYNYPNLAVTKYDPFVESFATQPQGSFDMVVCYNVLQTVEQEYLLDVIDHCHALTGQHLLLNILCNKKSPRDLDWWTQALNKYSILTKGASVPKASYDRQGETLQSQNLSFWIRK